MKFFITAHPIDRPHQEQLGIYTDSYVEKEDVGKIMEALIEKGHWVVNTCIANDTIHIHCSKK